MSSNSATFLHVTDAHIAYAGTALERDDRKTVVTGLPAQTREAALRQVCQRQSKILPRAGVIVGHGWRAYETAGRA